MGRLLCAPRVVLVGVDALLRAGEVDERERAGLPLLRARTLNADAAHCVRARRGVVNASRVRRTQGRGVLYQSE